MWLCGYTLNFMTLLGLSLAVGVLIDDAIVVRENIVRHLESGQDRVTAAREGTAEIGLAVAATTFSIMAVFVPVAFMGGVAGEWFRPFAITVVGLGDGQPVHLLHARSRCCRRTGEIRPVMRIGRAWLGAMLRASTAGSMRRPTATAA